MTNSIVTAHIVVFGRVQGVGFRYFVQGEARRLNLSGDVCNLSDGSVRIRATGDRSTIESLIGQISTGNGYSIVDKLDVKWKDGGAVSGEFKITKSFW